jgi:hypothetical protein
MYRRQKGTAVIPQRKAVFCVQCVVLQDARAVAQMRQLVVLCACAESERTQLTIAQCVNAAQKQPVPPAGRATRAPAVLFVNAALLASAKMLEFRSCSSKLPAYS